MSLGQRPNREPGGTARRILEHARTAFNERGVAAVGMREIARDLGLSPGNVSYHFATKDALVVALIEDAHARNNAHVASSSGPLDFAEVDALFRATMQRDLANRWLMRDAVGFLVAHPQLRPLSERLQRGREARLDAIVERLIEARLLEPRRTRRARPVLRTQIVTQVFFWLPAAILSAPDDDPGERLDTHARAAMALFLPYVTATGRRRLDALLR
jgi:AcrR family transcriptional regulator